MDQITAVFEVDVEIHYEGSIHRVLFLTEHEAKRHFDECVKGQERGTSVHLRTVGFGLVSRFNEEWLHSEFVSWKDKEPTVTDVRKPRVTG